MSSVVLIGAVRGLVSEGERVANVLKESKPEAVGLAISKEGLQAMKEHMETAEEKKAELENIEEEIYVAGLEAFGEVRKPPPCYAEAWKTAVALNIPAEPLDLNDDQYTNAYCRNISTLEMMTQGRAQRRIARHKFEATTPEEYVLEFDSVVNRQKGCQRLEAEREEYIAVNIKKLAKKHANTAAVVELERLEGVKRALGALGVSYTLI
jgi:pheromone shutdown protein TraB